MIQRYNMIQTQFGMIARAYDDGDIYKVSEVDPVIAKLEAEKERLRELVKSKDELLVCYRIGKKPSEKLLDKLYRLEQALKEE